MSTELKAAPAVTSATAATESAAAEKFHPASTLTGSDIQTLVLAIKAAQEYYLAPGAILAPKFETRTGAYTPGALNALKAVANDPSADADRKAAAEEVLKTWNAEGGDSKATPKPSFMSAVCRLKNLQLSGCKASIVIKVYFGKPMNGNTAFDSGINTLVHSGHSLARISPTLLQPTTQKWDGSDAARQRYIFPLANGKFFDLLNLQVTDTRVGGRTVVVLPEVSQNGRDLSFELRVQIRYGQYIPMHGVPFAVIEGPEQGRVIGYEGPEGPTALGLPHFNAETRVIESYPVLDGNSADIMALLKNGNCPWNTEGREYVRGTYDTRKYVSETKELAFSEAELELLSSIIVSTE